MECVEAKALKTSFWPEMTVKSNQQVVIEDLWGGNGTNNGVSGDETFVDDLLNFSNEDVEERVVRKEGNEDEQKGFLSVSSFQEQKPLLSSGASIRNDFASVFSSELSVPTDDLADLEWLSHFVEDSFSEDISLQYLDGKPTEKPQTGNSQKLSEPEPETPSLKPVGFPKRVPAKARSKRSRTGGRVWSLGSSSFTETSSSSSSSSSSTSSTSSCLIFNSAGQNLEFFDYLGKPPKKPKQKRQVNGGGTLVQRRCSHCGVQKTPQWRTGPLGAKTLCNACGVRYKSGRLLPEYRPAGSPTFLSDVHSNSHRKVLEMRRKKETAPPEPGLATAVHSF